VCTCAAGKLPFIISLDGFKKRLFSSIHWVSTESSLEWKSFKQKKYYTHTCRSLYALYTARAAKIVVRLYHAHVYRKSSEIRSDFVNFTTSLIHTHTAIYNDYPSSSLLAIHYIRKYSLFINIIQLAYMLYTAYIIYLYSNNMCEPFSYSTRVCLSPSSLSSHNIILYIIWSFFFHRIII